jgi:3-phenylpropionate/cinnamic acid dioxygenase small subunit
VTGECLDVRDVERFVYREARMADEHDYDGWEALWTDDAIYWVPIGEPDVPDPARVLSIIFDNRRRIATRLQQLRTGRRLAQSPPSRLRRVISNVEIVNQQGPDLSVEGNFVLVESRPREQVTWAGRVSYGLRIVDGELKMAYKRADLVNRDHPLPTLAFLL